MIDTQKVATGRSSRKGGSESAFNLDSIEPVSVRKKPSAVEPFIGAPANETPKLIEVNDTNGEPGALHPGRRDVCDDGLKMGDRGDEQPQVAKDPSMISH